MAAMSEEQKKKMAEGRKRKAAEKAAEAAKPKEAAKAAEPVMQAVYVTPNEKMVQCIYIDSVIANNEIVIGNGRKISGSGRVFSVPLSEFESTFITPLIAKLIKDRRIIVLDGMTDEQRGLYGCEYAENEVIRREGMFDFFFKKDIPEAAEIFGSLCAAHQELVAARFMDAYMGGGKHPLRAYVSRARVVALNNISKEKHNGEGIFKPLLEELNAEEV